MNLRLTKFFNFSASYETKGRIIGHNYVLGVTMDYLTEEDEISVSQKIQHDLIDQIHSKDFGLHVGFLKNKEIVDALLLGSFSEILKKSIFPLKIHTLTLKKDDRTSVSLEIGN